MKIKKAIGKRDLFIFQHEFGYFGQLIYGVQIDADFRTPSVSFSFSYGPGFLSLHWIRCPEEKKP